MHCLSRLREGNVLWWLLTESSLLLQCRKIAGREAERHNTPQRYAESPLIQRHIQIGLSCQKDAPREGVRASPSASLFMECLACLPHRSAQRLPVSCSHTLGRNTEMFRWHVPGSIQWVPESGFSADRVQNVDLDASQARDPRQGSTNRHAMQRAGDARMSSQLWLTPMAWSRPAAGRPGELPLGACQKCRRAGGARRPRPSAPPRSISSMAPLPPSTREVRCTACRQLLYLLRLALVPKHLPFAPGLRDACSTHMHRVP